MAFRQRNQTNLTSPADTPFDSDLLDGSTALVWIRISDNTVTIVSVVGSRNGAYALVPGLEFTDAATQQRVALYVKENVEPGSETVTVTASAAETTRTIVEEFTGRALSGVVDQTNNSGFTGVTATVNSGNITTLENDEDVAGFLAINAGSVTFTPGGSFIERTETDGDRIGAADLEDQAIGTYAFTGTLSEAQVHISIVVSLKAFAEAPAATPFFTQLGYQRV